MILRISTINRNLFLKISQFIVIGAFLFTGCEKHKDHHYTLNDGFHYLEGCKTKYWDQNVTEQDKELLGILSALYKRNVNKQFCTTQEVKIPKILHFIWLGPKNFPSTSVKYVRSWLAHHPDWQVIFWTDRFRLAPCEHMQVRYIQDFEWKYLKHYYDGTVNWAEKSDYLRYEILYAQGGIYVDHDIDCFRPLDHLVQNYHFFCGLELPHPQIEGYAITPCNALLGAIPQHDLFIEVMKLVHEKWKAKAAEFYEKRLSEHQLVMHRSYMPLMYAIKSKILTVPGDNIVFPAAYFYAKNPLPAIYAHHAYAATWEPSEEEKTNMKNIQAVEYFKNQSVKRKKMIILLFVINGILMGYLLFIGVKSRKNTV